MRWRWRNMTGSGAAGKARSRGRLLGVGVGHHGGGNRRSRLRARRNPLRPGGRRRAADRDMDHGQGHATTFKQVLSQKLGIDADRSATALATAISTMGIGTFGSRSAQLAGSAIIGAADRLIEKAAHRGAYDGGGERRHRVRARPVSDRRHRPRRVDRRGRAPGVPVGATAGRNRGRVYRALHFGPENAATFPGTHVCEVEIDAETGAVTLTRYCAVEMSGRC